MIRLVVDTNNIFHRFLHVIKKDPEFREDMKYRSSLISAVDNFFNSLSKMLPSYESIACFDSEDCWRKSIYDGYKGVRTKDRSFLNSAISEFQFKLSAKDTKCIKIDTYESDDIIAAVCDHNKDKGISTIIVSSDTDLNQLVYFEGHNLPFVIQFDPDQKNRTFVIDENYSEPENDIFSDDGYSELVMCLKKFPVKKINKFRSVIIKSLSGETGDSIPSCYRNINGKNRSLGGTTASKIYDMFPDVEQYTDESKLRAVIPHVLNLCNSNEINRIDEIIGNIRRNFSLIKLDSDNIIGYDTILHKHISNIC